MLQKGHRAPTKDRCAACCLNSCTNLIGVNSQAALKEVYIDKF